MAATSLRDARDAFFEVVPLDACRVDVVVARLLRANADSADGADHGPAAWQSTLRAALLQAQPGLRALQPQQMLQALQPVLAPALRDMATPLSLTYLRIDTEANTVCWLGCGAEQLQLWRADGRMHVLVAQHAALGAEPAPSWSQQQCALQAGDTLGWCSQGDCAAGGFSTLLAGSPCLALYGMERQRADLSGNGRGNSALCLLLMRHAPEPGVARLELALTLQALARLREFVARQAQAAGLAQARCDVLQVAAVEVVTNVIRHAVGLLRGAPLEIVAEISAQGLQLDFRYFGQAFEPPTLPQDADLSTYPQGGFGLFIIQQACDAVHYLHHDGLNTVRLKLLNGS